MSRESLRGRTPNDLIGEFRLPKPLPPWGSLIEAQETLARITGEEGWTLVGLGDFGRRESTEGRAVFAVREMVAKMRLGGMDSPADLARQEQKGTRILAEHLPEMVPPTLVVLCETEGELRPVAFQRRIRGAPVCQTPWEILESEILCPQWKKLKEGVFALLRRGEYPDICGQRLAVEKVERFPPLILVYFSPFFSDNLMIDGDGRLWCVDTSRPPQRVRFSLVGRLVAEMAIRLSPEQTRSLVSRLTPFC